MELVSSVPYSITFKKNVSSRFLMGIEDTLKELWGAERWEEAYSAAVDNASQLHPDYVRKAAAHWSHQLRHDKVGEGARNVLDAASAMPDADPLTFYGKAILDEEEGLLIRYFGGASADSLRRALGLELRASMLYSTAARNGAHEIVDAAEIENRRLRVLGVASTICIKLAEQTREKDKDRYIQAAVDYARQELEGRVAQGEGSGFYLANALSGLGLALGIAGDYPGAMEHLGKGQLAAQLGQRPLEASVYNFRMAAEVHRAEPDNREKIAQYFDAVFAAHQPGTTAEQGRWTPGVMATLREEMFLLSAHLGTFNGVNYQQRCEALYAPKATPAVTPKV